jgi:hypothetical protein
MGDVGVGSSDIIEQSENLHTQSILLYFGFFKETWPIFVFQSKPSFL